MTGRQENWPPPRAGAGPAPDHELAAVVTAEATVGGPHYSGVGHAIPPTGRGRVAGARVSQVQGWHYGNCWLGVAGTSPVTLWVSARRAGSRPAWEATGNSSPAGWTDIPR
jgi:hypothetical protein